jgi:hypothetical protein
MTPLATPNLAVQRTRSAVTAHAANHLRPNGPRLLRAALTSLRSATFRPFYE